MPEGDTIHKAAAKLRPALEGATLVRFEAARASGPMPRPGTTITAVEAQGKYLLVHFADGHVLQTHMKMTGRWDLYRSGERWWKPAHLARAVIEVEGWTAVCFSAPVVRIIRVKPDDRHLEPPDPAVVAPAGNRAEATSTTDEAKPASTWQWIDATARAAAPSDPVERAEPGEPAEPAERAEPIGAVGVSAAEGVSAADGPARADREPRPGDGLGQHRDQRYASLDHLGPDLCVAGVDLDVAVRRMGTVASPDDDIADVLLDQRVAAGVGNVFKSEVLWACRLHPLTPLGQVDEALRRTLLETAASQLQANLTTRRRTTVAGPPGSLAVYNRSRRPCRRCGTPIRWTRTGRDNRSTYWCPRCQPAPVAG